MQNSNNPQSDNGGRLEISGIFKWVIVGCLIISTIALLYICIALGYNAESSEQKSESGEGDVVVVMCDTAIMPDNVGQGVGNRTCDITELDRTKMDTIWVDQRPGVRGADAASIQFNDEIIIYGSDTLVNLREQDSASDDRLTELKEKLREAEALNISYAAPEDKE
jgi:hypothetical protein